MIRPLRQRHRLMACLLGVSLPATFAAGILVRQPVHIVPSVSSALTGQSDAFGKVLWTKADHWPGQNIITHLRQDPTGALAVELVFPELTQADVLVYWTAEKVTAAESLPTDARLLGALSVQAPIPLPPATRGDSGRLLLYSLADHQLVATSDPFMLKQD